MSPTFLQRKRLWERVKMLMYGFENNCWRKHVMEEKSKVREVSLKRKNSRFDYSRRREEVSPSSSSQDRLEHER